MSVELLTNYLYGLGLSSGLLSRQFCFEFIKDFSQAVIDNIKLSPDSNIRMMEMEKMEAIKYNLG